MLEVNSVRFAANTNKVVADREQDVTKRDFWSTIPIGGGVIAELSKY